MRAWLLGCVMCVGLGACGSDDPPPPTGPIEYTALRYDFAFDVETRAAASAVTVRVDTGGDCISIPARITNADGGTLNDEPIRSGQLQDDVLTLCGAGWESGIELTLRLTATFADETWDDSQVGYSVTTDLEGQPFYYLVSWVGGCDRFGPCDASPSAFATYRFTVTHPSGYRALCPGRVTPGETQTVCEFDYAGGPTYSTFGVAVSPSWVESDLGDWGGVRATLYDTPSSGVAAAFPTDNAKGFLAWMVDQFGAYPYGDELRFAVGPTYWNGFEHPGNIVLNDQLPVAASRYANGLAHTTNHELAHMWAGDQTTLSGVYDFVWKEAMAEYLTFVYDEETSGETVSLPTTAAWKYYSRFAGYYPVPGEAPPLLEYYGDVYGPGPVILFRQIEALFSRADVMQALAMLLGTERAIGVTDVKAALEQTTGADLTAYFDAWVYGEGTPSWPLFGVTLTDRGAGDYDVTVTQANPETLFGTAFAIRLTGDNSETHDVWIDLGPDGKAVHTVTASPGFPVTGHRFDPYGHTLATEGPAPTATRGPRVNPWVAPPRP